MEEFKQGDVVTLKSGSEKMTVYGTKDNVAYVTWFADNKFHTKDLLATLLTKID